MLSLALSTTQVAKCQQQHHTWATTLTQNEQEIDQLLGLLTDLLEQHNYRSLQHDAIDYYGDLNGLKARIQQLRHDFVCDGMACRAETTPHCNPVKATRPGYIGQAFGRLLGDFDRTKANCTAFLAGLVGLNLL